MRKLRLLPDIYTYNLMLRCTKECKGGDPNLLHDLLEHTPSKREQIEAQNRKIQLSKDVQQLLEGTKKPHATSQDTLDQFYNEDEGNKQIYKIERNSQFVEVSLKENMELEILSEELPPLAPIENPILPDLLSRKFNPGKVVDLVSLNKPEER